MSKLKWCKKILIALTVVILSPLIIVGVTIAGIYTLFQTPKDEKLPHLFTIHFYLLLRQTSRRYAKSEEIISKPPTLSRGRLGWGGRIRTDACGSQSPVPYRLATPQ